MEFKETLKIVKEWVSLQMKPFTTVDLIKYLESKNISIDRYSLGTIMKILSTEDLIHEKGTIKLKNHRKQLTQYKLWLSKEYRLKQQKNASKDNKGLTLDL